MDKSKAAADAVKLINQAKEDSNLQPLMLRLFVLFSTLWKEKSYLRRIDSSCIILLTKQVSPSIIIRCWMWRIRWWRGYFADLFKLYQWKQLDSWRRCHVASLPERTLGKIQERAEKSYFSECFNIFRKNILDIRDCKEDGIY